MEFEMRCKKCGGKKFSFKWKFNSESEIITAYFNHEGVGLRLEDAIIRCETCGAEANYEDAKFIKLEEVSE